MQSRQRRQLPESSAPPTAGGNKSAKNLRSTSPPSDSDPFNDPNCREKSRGRHDSSLLILHADGRNSFSDLFSSRIFKASGTNHYASTTFLQAYNIEQIVSD